MAEQGGPWQSTNLKMIASMLGRKLACFSYLGACDQRAAARKGRQQRAKISIFLEKYRYISILIDIFTITIWHISLEKISFVGAKLPVHEQFPFGQLYTFTKQWGALVSQNRLHHRVFNTLPHESGESQFRRCETPIHGAVPLRLVAHFSRSSMKCENRKVYSGVFATLFSHFVFRTILHFHSLFFCGLEI